MSAWQALRAAAEHLPIPCPVPSLLNRPTVLC